MTLRNYPKESLEIRIMDNMEPITNQSRFCQDCEKHYLGNITWNPMKVYDRYNIAYEDAIELQAMAEKTAQKYLENMTLGAED